MTYYTLPDHITLSIQSEWHFHAYADSFLYYIIRSYLETDAMIKAKYLAKEYMLNYIKKHDFSVFAIYRVIFAIIILAKYFLF